jgi:hypothetical protein
LRREKLFNPACRRVPRDRSSTGHRLMVVIAIANVPVRHLGDAPSSLGRRAFWDTSREALTARRGKVGRWAWRSGACSTFPSCRSGRLVAAASGERVKPSSETHALVAEGPTVPPRSESRGPGNPGRCCPLRPRSLRNCQARSNRGRRSMSTTPPGGCARVGKVGAIRTGADGAAEMLAELGMVLTDPGYRLADSAGHTGSSALGRGCGSSIATT